MPAGVLFDIQCGMWRNERLFPDGVGNKPWSDSDPHAMTTFYKNAAQWLPSWKGEDAALQIDYVRVWQ